MKKIFLLLCLIFVFVSCKEEKTEFIESKTMNLFLLKNLPKENYLVKKEIKLFLLNNPQLYKNKKHYYLSFYEYTSGTSCFLENKEDDGGPTSMHFLDNYEENSIASFIIVKCEVDTTKLVGKLRFDNKYGNHYQPDTIIGKCK